MVYIVEVETSTLCSFYMFITNTNTQTNIFQEHYIRTIRTFNVV